MNELKKMTKKMTSYTWSLEVIETPREIKVSTSISFPDFTASSNNLLLSIGLAFLELEACTFEYLKLFKDYDFEINIEKAKYTSFENILDPFVE